MKRMLLTALSFTVGLCVAIPVACAQSEDEKEVTRGKRGDWHHARYTKRQHDQLEYLEELQDAIVKDLDLDDEQRDAIERLFKDQIQRVTEEYKEERPADDEESRARMRELRSRLREAHAEGEKEAAKKLADELRSLKSDDNKLELLTKKFQEAITQELDDEQSQAFEKILARMEKKKREREQPGLMAIRNMQRAMKGVNLSKEQKKSVHELIRETMRSVKTSQQDPEAVSELATQLRTDILEELDEAQTEKFVGALDKLNAEMERRYRGAKRHGDGRVRPDVRDGKGTSKGAPDEDHEEHEESDDDAEAEQEQSDT